MYLLSYNHTETKLVYLVSGKRILSSIPDPVRRGYVCSTTINLIFHCTNLYGFIFLSMKMVSGLEIFSFYLIGSIQYFLFLTYFFKLFFFQKSNGEFSYFIAISILDNLHRKSSGTID